MQQRGQLLIAAGRHAGDGKMLLQPIMAQQGEIVWPQAGLEGFRDVLADGGQECGYRGFSVLAAFAHADEIGLLGFAALAAFGQVEQAVVDRLEQDRQGGLEIGPQRVR